MAADKEAVGEHNWCGAPDADELLGRLHHQFQCDGFLDRRGGRLVVLVDGEAIGDVSWRPAQWGPSEGSVCPTIGIALLPQFRGKGYGTIEQRALEKAGFRREGIVRDAEERDGRFHDHVLYGLLREEWQAASAE